MSGVEKVKRGGTKQDALGALKALQRERDEGQDYIPLGDILSAYGQNIADTKKRNTLRSFREGEAILLERFGRDFCVHDLTRGALNKLLADRLDSRAPITANKPCKVLRAALHYAVANNRLKGMPCKVPTPTETRRKPRILTKSEFLRVRSACKHPAASLAITLAYQAGLRHDEIVHLRVKDWQPSGHDPYTIEVRAHDGWTPKAHAERGVDLPRSRRSSDTWRARTK